MSGAEATHYQREFVRPFFEKELPEIRERLALLEEMPVFKKYLLEKDRIAQKEADIAAKEAAKEADEVEKQRKKNAIARLKAEKEKALEAIENTDAMIKELEGGK